MRIRVTELDSGPDDLFAQLPFEIDLIRQIPGPDRPDYWLGQLTAPLKWTTKDTSVFITHVVLAARLVNSEIRAGMPGTPVNIAYVVDASLLHDSHLDFVKCAYVAIGLAIA